MSGRTKAALSGRFAHIHSSAQSAPARLEDSNSRARDLQVRIDRRKLLRAFALTTVALAVIVAVIALWSLVLRDRFVVKRFGTVVPGKVYRSGQISRFLIGDVIERNGLGTIIDLNGLDPNDADQRAEVEASQEKGVRHLRFPLRGDATGPIDRYAGAVQAMVESELQGRPVLVHCAAGAQRTGACISFYRLLIRHDPAEDVYRELVSYGWDPKANQVLLDYVNGHMHELAKLLVERHVLDREPDPLPFLHP
ncbi:MAG TPA: tyrosine-protein phosphatase [Planctomycetaceae bacterium]|jgi:protein tyrosine/serine phosphatase|nr:tyrosine-protein phosphatase [Planctomycetaceae bacterium]